MLQKMGETRFKTSNARWEAVCHIDATQSLCRNTQSSSKGHKQARGKSDTSRSYLIPHQKTNGNLDFIAIHDLDGTQGYDADVTLRDMSAY